MAGAYPRMRGGTWWSNRVDCKVMGLSPHARGNRQGQYFGHTFHGPIPACAGEPLAK